MSKPYDEYSKEYLVKRIKELEKTLSDAPTVKHLADLEKRNHMLSAEIGGIINAPDCAEECVPIETLKIKNAKLKKALEEAREEVGELRYRFRLIGIDNPLTAEEEKNYKSPLHYCPHGIKITETCVDCGRKE